VVLFPGRCRNYAYLQGAESHFRSLCNTKCPQQTVTSPYPEPAESNPHTRITCFNPFMLRLAHSGLHNGWVTGSSMLHSNNHRPYLINTTFRRLDSSSSSGWAQSIQLPSNSTGPETGIAVLTGPNIECFTRRLRVQSPKRRVFNELERWIMPRKFLLITHHRHKPSDFKRLPFFGCSVTLRRTNCRSYVASKDITSVTVLRDKGGDGGLLKKRSCMSHEGLRRTTESIIQHRRTAALCHHR
jgi:hypothetical protein